MSATGYTPRRPLAQIVEPAASHGMTVWQLVEEQYPPRPARSAKAARAAAERGRGAQAFVAQFGFGYHRDSHGVIEAGRDRFPLRCTTPRRTRVLSA